MTPAPAGLRPRLPCEDLPGSGGCLHWGGTRPCGQCRREGTGPGREGHGEASRGVRALSKRQRRPNVVVATARWSHTPGSGVRRGGQRGPPGAGAAAQAQIWKDRRVLLLSFVASLSLNHLCITKIQRCICKAPFPAVNALLAAHVSCTCPRVLPSSAWPGSLSFILRRAPVPSPVFRTLPRSRSPQSFLKHWISLIKNYSSVQSFTMIYFINLKKLR